MIKVQTMKLPKKEASSDKPEELIPIPLANDRALEPHEEEAEEKAVKLPRKQFKRILPLPGTLGYLFRDISGGNQSIFNFVNNSLSPTARQQSSTNAYKIYRVILLWNSLDEYSQNRVDVWDWLCNKVGIACEKFYAQTCEGMFNSYEAVSQRLLLESKPEMLNNIRQFARKERNFRDRELLAKATGVTKDVPLIGEINNSTKITNLTFESGFKDVLRSTEKLVRTEEELEFLDGEIVEEQKQLPSANLEEIIDAEWLSNPTTSVNGEKATLAVENKEKNHAKLPS